MNWRWPVVLLGSAVGGGIVLGIMLAREKKELDRRGVELRQQLESPEGQAIVTRQIAQMRIDLGNYAERVANQAADDHIGTYYGLTQERMQAVERLVRSFGVT